MSSTGSAGSAPPICPPAGPRRPPTRAPERSRAAPRRLSPRPAGGDCVPARGGVTVLWGAPREDRAGPMTARRARARTRVGRSGRGGGAVRETGERPLTTVAMFSRRHIDLQRVAGALCPGVRRAVPGPDGRTATPPRTAG
ncbi:putative leader peptide [Streptomyces polygonati]|uniref:Leader peptide n=1 Tax=Streptomyces polygonati TaxID=1617087 RepID=A0ABV8HHW7_9ACTN